MAVAKVLATCPFCKEPIAGGAIKCKHCQSVLPEPKKKDLKSFITRLNTFRYGFLTGVIFSLALVILIYFQFFRD